MKKHILLRSFIFGMILIASTSKAQVSHNLNFRVPFDFLGYNGVGFQGPLQIRNNFINQPIDFFAGGAQRMRIFGNFGIPGLVKIYQNGVFNSNRINMQVGGPIESDAMHGAASDNTILFGYTSPTGVPTGPWDGFRMRFKENYSGPNGDAWIFEKTDQNSLVPDGCIAFTNTGMTGIETLSMKIEGTGRVGIGRTFVATPIRNRLQIDPFTGDPYFGSVNGCSGLRLTRMTSASTPAVNTGNLGLLSVDANGDVVYVNGGGAGVGGYCSVAPPPLTSDFKIPLGNTPGGPNASYYFSGQSDVRTNVGIGFNCSPLRAKFHVKQDYRNYIYNLGSTTTDISVAGKFDNTLINASSGLAFAIGVWGNTSDWDLTNTASITPANANVNIGGFFAGIPGPSTSSTYGVYAIGPSGGGGYAGNFDGDVNINGNGSVSGTWTVSDQIFKRNIDTISNVMSIIKQLKPRTYFMDTLNQFGMNFTSQRNYGLIAEDVAQVLPELTKEFTKPTFPGLNGNVFPSVTYRAINYTEFIPFLIAGIKEQQQTIDSLKTKTTKQDSINNSLQNQINNLSNIINQCCSSHIPPQQINTPTNGNNTPANSNTISSMDVKLSDVQAIVLNQNQPNPFAQETTITYFLTDDVSKAQMLFYNASGTLIKSVELTQRGQGQLNVFAQDLTSGMYTYTLVVDGQIFATKKMVKQ